MEEDDKGCPMIRMGVTGECFFWYWPTQVVPDNNNDRLMAFDPGQPG